MPNLNLSKLQKDILVFFGQNSFADNFYWTGGTLLSYHYLHHRNSVDLDFFSDNLFTNDEYLLFVNQLKKETNSTKIKLIKEQNRRMYLIERGAEKVKIELVYFPFKFIEKRRKMAEFSVKIDSLTDIMVNKILSAYQRNEPKDVFDLYCYLSEKPKYNLHKLISLIEKKFGISIETTILLAKMYELADKLDIIQPLLLQKEKNLSNVVKNFFQKIFNKKVKKIIK